MEAGWSRGLVVQNDDEEVGRGGRGGKGGAPGYLVPAARSPPAPPPSRASEGEQSWRKGGGRKGAEEAVRELR